MADSTDKLHDDTLENKTPGDERPLFRDLLARAHVKTKCVSKSDPPEHKAVFRATVTMLTDYGTADFIGHGDSYAGNTHPLIAPHYIRMAETRAIARALRWATKEGRTSMKEMPHFDGSIAQVDFINKKINRPEKPSKNDRRLLFEAIERGEKLIGQSEKMDLLRKKLPKHRLHYNSIPDLAAYREELRREYRQLNPASEDADE